MKFKTPTGAILDVENPDVIAQYQKHGYEEVKEKATRKKSDKESDTQEA